MNGVLCSDKEDFQYVDQGRATQGWPIYSTSTVYQDFYLFVIVFSTL